MSKVESGKTYIGFACRKCKSPIPIAEDESGKVALDGPGRIQVKCQKCGRTGTYRTDEAQHFQGHTLH